MFADPLKNIEQFGLLPGMKVVDVGAGSGHYTFALSKAVGHSGKVYAVDIQKDLLERIKNTAHTHRLTNIEILSGDVEKKGGIAVRDGLLDAAVISNVLFQIEDKAGLVREVGRVLKPGGLALVIDWNASKASGASAGLMPQGALGETQVRALFEGAGGASAAAASLFTELRTIRTGDHHYGIIYKKKA